MPWKTKSDLKAQEMLIAQLKFLVAQQADMILALREQLKAPRPPKPHTFSSTVTPSFIPPPSPEARQKIISEARIEQAL